jgi:hypothetical protein
VSTQTPSRLKAPRPRMDGQAIYAHAGRQVWREVDGKEGGGRGGTRPGVSKVGALAAPGCAGWAGSVDPRSMGHLMSCSCGAAVGVDNTATPHTGAGPSISASRNRRGLRGAASRPLPGRCGATATVPVPDISGIVTPAADADRDVTFGLLRPQASRLRTSRIALEAHTQPLDIGSRQLADQRRKMGQRSPGQGIPQ